MMKKIIFAAIAAIVVVCPAYLHPEEKKGTEKPRIIKIKNTGEIITMKQLDQIPPKTIKCVDISGDSIIITLKDKPSIPPQNTTKKK